MQRYYANEFEKAIQNSFYFFYFFTFFSDNQGFLYFNDILFATMKKTYHDQVFEFSNEISKKKLESIERKTLTKLNFLQKTNVFELNNSEKNNKYKIEILYTQ